MNATTLLDRFQELMAAKTPEQEVRLAQDDLRALWTGARLYFTLYEIGKRVASEMEIDALLRLAMDKVIEITRAQRGFIALVKDKKRLDFEIARNLEKSDVELPQFQVSRSIIQAVIDEGRTIRLPDAMTDTTFGVKESVLYLQLLSVLCTPIKIEDRVIGVVYLDSLNQRELFDESVEDLLYAFSQQVAIALKNALLFSDLKKSHEELAFELRAKYRFDQIVGFGHHMTKLLNTVANVANTEATILIQGESGTGKELIARALHDNHKDRRDRKFVAVNCAAIPKESIEDELFGHLKGAFTGAVNDRQGDFAKAEGGTIFLDEIGEMEPALQVKLLRVLQEREYSPLGSSDNMKCNVRVIAATSRDLRKMLATGVFREELFYRLNVINLTVPSLRERREDILPLVDHFIRKYGAQYGKSERSLRLSKGAERSLLEYDYPGNVRELENATERAVILCKGEYIEIDHLPESIGTVASPDPAYSEESHTFGERRKAHVQEWEIKEIVSALIKARGNQSEAAEIMQIDRSELNRKVHHYGINPGDYAK